mmetsp:Transcript_71797/g.126777  ORF Transcript_71797/g.126777 Transcript_71797/m.126777 type:complete len:322 (+) Transcript_71797:2246-3211(+)
MPMEVLPCEESREASFPIHAVQDHCAVWKDSVLKDRLVELRLCIVAKLIKRPTIAAPHHVLSRGNRQVELVTILLGELSTICSLAKLGQRTRINDLMRQELKNLQRPPTHIACPGEDGGKRTKSLWETVLADSFPSKRNSSFCLVQGWVHEGRADVQKGRAEAEGEKSLTKASQEINCSSIAGKSAKGDQARIAPGASLCDTFVVNESNLFLNGSIEERHARWLCFDGVGKEDPVSTWEKELRWHFLDGDNGGCFRQIFSQLCSSFLVLRICEHSSCARLNKHAKSLTHQCLNMSRSNRHPPLPFVLVLSPDSQHARLASC